MSLRMNTKTVRACLLAGLLVSPLLKADQSDTHKSVGGMDVYIGVIPAEVIRGRGSGGEQRMHGGVPRLGGLYHLVAALFDQTTGTRIINAHVTAEVTEPGLAIATHKPLEPMKIADAVTYGNYFALANKYRQPNLLERPRAGEKPRQGRFRILSRRPIRHS